MEKIATDIKYQWSAGEVCFDCPCGVQGIMLSEGGDERKCQCGRTYVLHHCVSIVEPLTNQPYTLGVDKS